MDHKLLILLLSYILNSNTQFVPLEKVVIKPYSNIKHFNVPTSNDPVITWMDVQKGLFPNTTTIQGPLSIGDPITIFIYLKDKDGLYDLRVTDCWAYDETQKLHLTDVSKESLHVIDKWYKFKFDKGQEVSAFLYTNLKVFKFPENNQINLKCDIELCFKNCKN